jgi:anti-anti-sigma factor
MTDIVVRAPVHLSAQTRGAFREDALRAIEELSAAQEAGRLVVDLGQTLRIDSAGLGTLVMLQLRAAERRHTVCLRGVSEELRFLLLMTRLEDRFDIEGRA